MFNLDFPDSNHLAKTFTVVSGPDTVNLTYHNFFASKEKVTQVGAIEQGAAASLSPLSSTFAFMASMSGFN